MQYIINEKREMQSVIISMEEVDAIQTVLQFELDNEYLFDENPLKNSEITAIIRKFCSI